MDHTTTAVTGLRFAESPSHGPDGKLYVSDFYAHRVLRFDVPSADPDGSTWDGEVVADVPGQPSGLGWLPDGRLLVVSMLDRKVLRWERESGLVEHADVSGVALGAANDMHVDADGTAWVGSFGFDFYAQLAADPDADPLFGPGADPPGATLTRVGADGGVSPSAPGLAFPNGIVRLRDGTLLIAETVTGVLTAFTEGPGGELRDRRVWADLRHAGADGGAILPDGICVDSEDAVWVSDPTHSAAVRVREGGAVTDLVHTGQPCFAVGLAGADGRTLVCCTAPTSNPNTVSTRELGRLEAVRVRVPAWR